MNNGQPYDPEIFTLDQDDRSITIETDDMDLQLTVLSMVLEIDNIVTTISDSFKVTFQDGCSNGTLNGA